MKTILVIEDERVIRDTIVEILKLCDYEVVQACNGEEGFAMAITYLPDLILCDVMMPKMNGLDTFARFRKHPILKFIPFVFLSALAEMKDIRKGMSLGADDYLTKPFHSKELLKVIDIQLNKSDEKEDLSHAVSDLKMREVVKELTEKSEENEEKWHSYLKSAGRIQSVILPKKEQISAMFPRSFNYYRPKYSVFGDFYWMQYLGDKKLIAVADCTGHGIPAALLTIFCYNGLNLAVRYFGLREPAEILLKVNELVTDFMQEHGRVNHGLGMDILLCAIDEKSKEIKYAGARRPLYIVTPKLRIDAAESVQEYSLSEKYNSLFRIRGSLYTVGGCHNNFELKEHTINYRKGDIIYLTTDGYSDQFGGNYDKRFKSRNLIRLLMSIQHEEMRDQEQIIAQTFQSWKGITEQTDDVTLFGIRL